MHRLDSVVVTQRQKKVCWSKKTKQHKATQETINQPSKTHNKADANISVLLSHQPRAFLIVSNDASNTDALIPAENKESLF